MKKRTRNQSLHGAYTDPTRVYEEIACIEARLAEIGHDGDCAYEKAMIRFLQEQVKMRRDWLTRMECSPLSKSWYCSQAHGSRKLLSG